MDIKQAKKKKTMTRDQCKGTGSMTVCASCGYKYCWDGYYMCEKARESSTKFIDCNRCGGDGEEPQPLAPKGECEDCEAAQEGCSVHCPVPVQKEPMT